MTAPKLRFKEFDGDWSASNLEKTTEYFKGFAFKSESYKEDGIRIIRVSDLDKDSIKYQNEAIFLDETEAQNYLNWEVKKKDIIVTTVGSKPHLIDSAVGRPIFVQNNNEGLLNQNLLILRPKNENIDAYFIFAQLLDKKYLTHIETIQRGNANQSNITVKDLQEFQVFQTSKEEQTKIASFLSAVDEKINQLSQKHNLLSQYKQGMMQKLFSQQIRFKADDGSEFGEWEEKKLVDISNIITGTTPETANKSFYEGDYLFVSPVDIQENRYILQTKTTLTESGFKKCRAIPENSILFVCIGSTIGKVAQNKKICATNQQINAVIPDDGYCADYVYFQLLLQAQLIKLRAGTQAVPIINKNEFGKTTLLMPCLEEQTKIANFLSAIDQKIEVVAQQIEQAKQWKKGLLQQMFV